MLLDAAGYAMLEAADGEEALRHLGSSGVDVMLTDLKMEPMDGMTLLKRALELTPQTQVILMTAYGSIEGAVEAMRRGAYDYVTKPFQERELVHKVARAVERGRLLTTVNILAGDFNARHGLVGGSQ
jgi:two-component system response regulator HydG